MHKLICKCCKKILRSGMAEDWEHAERIADRHLNFYTEYSDPRCQERHKAHQYMLAYDLIEISAEELEERRHQEYMNGANL
jgi:hypothetical protein